MASDSESPKTPTGSQPASPEAKAPATGSQPAVQSPQEQLDGLRAWVAQIDRRLGVRSIAGGLALVLALAAGIVGVVLAKQAQDDSATKAEVRTLSERVSANTEETTQAVKDEITALNDRLDGLESRVSTLAADQRTSGSEINVVQDDIDELRGQITDLQDQLSAAQSAQSDTSGTNN